MPRHMRLCCLVLCVMCAFIHVSVYTLNFDVCTSPEHRFRVFYGVDIERCKYECARRPHCRQLNYQLNRKECGLFTMTDGSKTNKTLTCAVISKEDIGTQLCNCPLGMACLSNGSCLYEECPSVPRMPAIRGTDEGNMLHIGAKRKLTCGEGFFRDPGNKTLVCETNGQWFNYTLCIWKCSQPCSKLPFTQIVSLGGSTEGDTRIYNCLDGFSVSKKVAFITATCNINGWRYPKSKYCVNETVYPRNPANAFRKGCMKYEINNVGLTHTESLEQCRQYGELVKINIVNKQNAITKLLSAKTDAVDKYWIQGNLTDDTWKFNDGTAITQPYWTGNQPNETGNCVLVDKIYGWKWNDKNCTNVLGYICEYTEIPLK